MQSIIILIECAFANARKCIKLKLVINLVQDRNTQIDTEAIQIRKEYFEYCKDTQLSIDIEGQN